ncbi:MAG: hypothetical protein WBG86_01380 [Polyangiales bacterium]
MPQDPQYNPQEPETPSAVHDNGTRRNAGIWAGLGCLGVIVLSCCLLSYWAQAFGFTWVLNQGDEVRSYASRVVLSGSLQAIRSTCAEGRTSEDVERWFHPDVPQTSRNALCDVDEATIQQIGSAEQVSANSLAVTGESDLAERFQMDPTLCYRYTAETLGLVGCFQTGDAVDTIPFKIIEVDKP